MTQARTHYADCWKYHPDCAEAKVSELEKRISVLEKALNRICRLYVIAYETPGANMDHVAYDMKEIASFALQGEHK